MKRPSVSTRPIGPNQVEIRTTCRHGAYHVGMQLDTDITERVAICAALGHHHTMKRCGCMKELWRRYRTAPAPADVDALRTMIDGVWDAMQQAGVRV